MCDSKVTSSGFNDEILTDCDADGDTDPDVSCDENDRDYSHSDNDRHVAIFPVTRL
ncbi:hypothetical protein BS47DRAFT_1345434 [Hydnum rufescens UP504]|uniref:Uncharacterized protein n=1 Tax=Hydnum rufescens UP504 TaxID=1448309 RepID=A0A9P6AVK6_9AGAM|nr:hypothetical protein BS47DRAFT_1345434 [Hydnum rufescens UP504]